MGIFTVSGWWFVLRAQHQLLLYPLTLPVSHEVPPLTLTVTFHHPEQSLLHKLHWLDHVIRVGVFSVLVFRARQHTTPTPSLTPNFMISLG